jgi:hypothetical protein
MDSKLILVVIGVIATAFGRSEAITCYKCDSVTVSNCKDPFNSDGVEKCEQSNTVACYKTYKSVSGGTEIIRGCSSDAIEESDCEDRDFGGVKGIYCRCKSANCNDGQMVKPTLRNVIAGAALATVTAIIRMNQG